MMMRTVIRLDTQRTMVEAYLPKDPALNEEMKVLVDGSEGNRRDFCPHSFVNLFRTWMTVHSAQHLVNYLALVRHRDARSIAQQAELIGFRNSHRYELLNDNCY